MLAEALTTPAAVYSEGARYLKPPKKPTRGAEATANTGFRDFAYLLYLHLIILGTFCSYCNFAAK